MGAIIESDGMSNKPVTWIDCVKFNGLPFFGVLDEFRWAAQRKSFHGKRLWLLWAEFKLGLDDFTERSTAAPPTE